MRAIAQFFGCLQHFLTRLLAHMPGVVSIEDVGHRRSGDSCFASDIRAGIGGSSRSEMVVFFCHNPFLGGLRSPCILGHDSNALDGFLKRYCSPKHIRYSEKISPLRFPGLTEGTLNLAESFSMFAFTRVSIANRFFARCVTRVISPLTKVC